MYLAAEASSLLHIQRITTSTTPMQAAFEAKKVLPHLYKPSAQLLINPGILMCQPGNPELSPSMRICIDM
jgi:hypothetical protein